MGFAYKRAWRRLIVLDCFLCAAQLVLDIATEYLIAVNARHEGLFIGVLPTSGTVGLAEEAKQQNVRGRQLQYDCKFLLAVLNWATTVTDAYGRSLLERNPLKGLEVPREESPVRPQLDDADYRALLTVAGSMHPQFQLALVLGHETGHRLGSIRMLRWSDIDLKHHRIRWRAENDKIEFEHVTRLTGEAVAALESARTCEAGIGDAWVFPAQKNPARPTDRHRFRRWWDAAIEEAKLSPLAGRGWHSLRRQFATEMKHAPLKDLAYLGGWKSVATVVDVYQRPDDRTMDQALAARRAVSAGA